MSTWISTGDVEVDYGPLDADSLAKVQVLIARAEALVAAAVPDLLARVNAGLVARVTVQQVVSEMVVAVLRNPDGVRSFTRTEGPFSGSQTYAAPSPGGLELTRRQRTLLGARGGSGGAFTINTSPGAVVPAWVPSWWENAGQGWQENPESWGS